MSQLLGFERELTRDWVQEEPVTMTRAELRELFGPQASAEHTRRAAQSGYVRLDGDRVTYPSRRLLEATVALVRQGVPLGEILDAGDFVQAQAAAADRFVALFRRHVIGTEGLERLSATDLDHIREAVAALRPVAGEVVAAEFSRAMARRVEAEVAVTAIREAKLHSLCQSVVTTLPIVGHLAQPDGRPEGPGGDEQPVRGRHPALR